jgi:hypothetical protein
LTPLAIGLPEENEGDKSKEESNVKHKFSVEKLAGLKV